MENTPRLVGYCRVSTLEQARDGLSLEAQEHRLRAYTTAQGAELVAFEIDDGISGATPPERRPALARALAMLRRGQADGLVVVKLDRLSRSTRHVLDLLDAAQRNRWRLISVAESLDTRTAVGEFTTTILAGLAQMERKLIGERTREAMSRITDRARSGIVPFGYRTDANPDSLRVCANDRSPLVAHDEEQAVLRRMLALRDEGLGARRIARSLGVSPRTGRPWTPSGVQKVLRTAERRRAA
ncbi:MAG: recombinase family protein [Myxococcales bacterium]|nr:recombinase family protein [Myxococcales bacterium]